jgi:DNA mismatch endonuclease (patch repair protein)
MTDTVDKETRSRMMSQIRSRGNKSTEIRLRMLLVRGGISGWNIQPKGVTGNPDFIFAKARVAVFVDGCFWHGCPECGHIPKSNRKYWQAKILRNIERDEKQRAELAEQGWTVLRIWEHELNDPEEILASIQSTLLQTSQSNK